MIKDKEIKFKLSTLLISLLVLGGIFCLFILSFTLFGGTVLSQFGWETTSNAISFTALIATAVSIIFLYANFIQQQKQIDDQKKDTEYNRVLDVVYRQLDLDIKKISDVELLIDDLQINTKEITDIISKLEAVRVVVTTALLLNHNIERFLVRSKLSISGRGHMYALYYDNLPLKFTLLINHIRKLIEDSGSTYNDRISKLHDCYKVYLTSVANYYYIHNQIEMYNKEMVKVRNYDLDLRAVNDTMFGGLISALEVCRTTRYRLMDENIVDYNFDEIIERIKPNNT
ncbi:hypothetical protein [Sphingobacterium chungjuense]|uniref:hypothetical protein n=1 Tax=Sphingobacterium chungjuense TaxID=2675553 RepID=UPI00140A13A8|nr:hypothetical protein [Sphingobacterium chungjuense]